MTADRRTGCCRPDRLFSLTPRTSTKGKAMNDLSYTRGRQDKPLLAMTIGAAFDATVARFPQREALVVRHQGLRYSWTQLADVVDSIARAFLALGLRAGDRLGI